MHEEDKLEKMKLFEIHASAKSKLSELYKMYDIYLIYGLLLYGRMERATILVTFKHCNVNFSSSKMAIDSCSLTRMKTIIDISTKH